MNRWQRFGPLIASLALAACASVPPEPAPPALPMLSQEDIVTLSKQGVGVDGIVSRLKETRTRYRLTAADVLSLSQRGVSSPVIDYLLDSDRIAMQQECNRRLQQVARQQDAVCWQQCFMSCPPWPTTYPHHWRRWP